MDRSAIYEKLFQGKGTPIRCKTQEEVDQIIGDMIQMFPYRKKNLRIIGGIFGSCIDDKIYEDEIVFRFNYEREDSISLNFCTYDFYRERGYEIVEFSEVFTLDTAPLEEDDELHDDWMSLYG